MTIVCGTLPGILLVIYFAVGAMIMLRDFGVEIGLVILPAINTTADRCKVTVTNILLLLAVLWVDSRCLNLQQHLDHLILDYHEMKAQFLALGSQCLLMDLIMESRGHRYLAFHLGNLPCLQVPIHLF
jgi:hypothetical protein